LSLSCLFVYCVLCLFGLVTKTFFFLLRTVVNMEPLELRVK
jgi:hypothetical protein